MKNKLFLILFIIILTSISAVSADNVTDVRDNINVTVAETVYAANITPIEVSVPENTTGNLRATVDMVEIYNENITGPTVKIPVKIPKFPVQPNTWTDHSTHRINIFYNGLEVGRGHTMKVMKYLPDKSFDFHTDTVIIGDDYPPAVIFADSANGNVLAYLDGELFENATARKFFTLNITDLSTGCHTLKIIYSGDDYYLPKEESYNFTAADMIIDIPVNFSLSDGDAIHIKSPKSKNATASVYVDGKRISRQSLDSRGEMYEFLKGITCGMHNVLVEYRDANSSRSLNKTVNVTYGVRIYEEHVIYGRGMISVMYVCDDFSSDLIEIAVDGKPVEFEYSPRCNFIDIDVSSLEGGNHTVTFTYKGDSKYCPYSLSHNFTVDYAFSFYEGVSLSLPGDANGVVEVYVDGRFYKSQKLLKGFAEIALDDMGCGFHNVTARYVGDDYNVCEDSMIVLKSPDVDVSSRIYVGEDKFITVSGCGRGHVIFSVGGESWDADVENGSARLSLKGLEAGKHDVVISYIGSDGFSRNFTRTISVLENYKITASNRKMTYSGVLKYSAYIKHNGKAAKNMHVKFKIAGKVFSLKTDGKGRAQIRISGMNVGKHTLAITCASKKVKRTITVKHAITVKVKKASKRITVKVNLKKINGKYIKNAKVTVKVNGKSFKIKTNSGGVCKVTVKKPKVKRITVKARYLGDTVKKTVRV